MPLNWTHSREIAEKLDQLYRDCDLLVLDPEGVEEMVLSAGLIATPVPAPHRQNILKSILWSWMRLRGALDDDSLTSCAG